MANIISFYDCVAHVNLVLSAGTGCARENNKRQRLTPCKSSAIITSFYNCVSSPRPPLSDLVTITPPLSQCNLEQHQLAVTTSISTKIGLKYNFHVMKHGLNTRDTERRVRSNITYDTAGRTNFSKTYSLNSQ